MCCLWPSLAQSGLCVIPWDGGDVPWLAEGCSCLDGLGQLKVGVLGGENGFLAPQLIGS